jgi:hypothetical protein
VECFCRLIAIAGPSVEASDTQVRPCHSLFSVSTAAPLFRSVNQTFLPPSHSDVLVTTLQRWSAF